MQHKLITALGATVGCTGVVGLAKATSYFYGQGNAVAVAVLLGMVAATLLFVVSDFRLKLTRVQINRDGPGDGGSHV